ncbi:MAG: hypothetical protein DHS20C15_27880 [Planctomycetota bacterium]|nr:MAG: hypothetical protein DHS20C15_27880 [Planctomycetota bacterium]
MSSPPSSDPVDALLVSALLAGHADALDRWYRSEHPVVHRLCLGFLAHAHEADDAAQDAMLHLLDRLERYDPQRAYTAWRNTVVLNHCRDRRRRGQTRDRHEQHGAESSLPHALPSPEDAATSKERAAILHAALSALSEREREAFVLRDLEQRDTREVATTLGISESSVRSLLTLARRRLRTLLAPRLPEMQAR